ncbi:MAG: D-arabinono-1,4-lactone oxidase [Ginsengibacter sp.]
MIQPAANGLYHPANETDIVDLVEYAIQNKLQVRVRGAAQSVAESVYADGYDAASGTFGKNINIELDQMRDVTFGDGNNQVTVGGGCNLGTDPFDPAGVSQLSDDKNLFFQLNEKGLSIPNVSGAIHQTIAGFISTGSSGGTMQHSFEDCILSIRIIDGTGKINIFNRSDNPADPFYAIPVSMGLLGIITQVTLQCVPTFNIIGQQSTTLVADCAYDFFGPGSNDKPSLETYIRETEFSRILWWPIQSLKRAISWKAKTMEPGDYTAGTGSPDSFKPKPYQPMFPALLGSTLPSEGVAVTGFQLIATWPDWLYTLLGNSSAETSFKEKLIELGIEKAFPYFYPLLTDFYFPVNTSTDPPQVFWDNWLNSLPMDKVEYSSNLFNLAYSEMWVPADKAMQLVNVLEADYNQKGYSATGFYTVEILGAKKSDCWLSPAYGSDAVRINILYFQKSTVIPADFFQQFWDLLSTNNIPFRPHWGKALPATIDLNANYPKWSDWKALRDQMDPHQVFLTAYWNGRLGLT